MSNIAILAGTIWLALFAIAFALVWIVTRNNREDLRQQVIDAHAAIMFAANLPVDKASAFLSDWLELDDDDLESCWPAWPEERRHLVKMIEPEIAGWRNVDEA